MTRIIIGTLVGTVILFVFQAMSWMVLPIHKDSFAIVKDQDSVLNYLGKHLKGDSVYAMPMPPKNLPMDQHEKWIKPYEGKPEATIYYHNKMEMGSDMMVMGMIKGFIIDLVAVLIVVLILGRAISTLPGFMGRLMLVFGFGIFLVVQGSLMQWNWFHTPGHFISGEIIDALLGWLLVGVWLAWYTGRRSGNSPA